MWCLTVKLHLFLILHWLVLLSFCFWPGSILTTKCQQLTNTTKKSQVIFVSLCSWYELPCRLWIQDESLTVLDITVTEKRHECYKKQQHALLHAWTRLGRGSWERARAEGNNIWACSRSGQLSSFRQGSQSSTATVTVSTQLFTNPQLIGSGLIDWAAPMCLM